MSVQMALDAPVKAVLLFLLMSVQDEERRVQR